MVDAGTAINCQVYFAFFCILAETLSIAMHPSVFKQHNFPRDRSDTIKRSLEVDQLLALIVLCLQRVKDVQTREGDIMRELKNLPKFTAEWSSRPHGGDDLMLESLGYKTSSLTDFAIYPPTEMKDEVCARSLTSLSHVKNQIKLVEEIKPQPRWQLNQTRKVPNAYEYTIQLPSGTRMEDCELDISPVSRQ